MKQKKYLSFVLLIILIFQTLLTINALEPSSLVPADHLFNKWTPAALRIQGKTMPFTIYPTTNREAEFIQNKSELSLPETGNKILQKNNSFAFDADLTLSLEGYSVFDLETGKLALNAGYPALNDENSRKSLIEFPLNMTLFNTVFASTTIELQEDPLLYFEGENNYTNIPSGAYDIHLHFPLEAYFSTSGKNGTAMFGRLPTDYGPGDFGSLILSDDSEYFDSLFLHGFWDKISLTFLVSSMEVWTEGLNYSNGNYPHSLSGTFSKTLTLHSLEYTPFENWRIGLTESHISGGELGASFAQYNPLLVFHNYYIPEYGNILFQFDSSLVVFPGFEIYAACLIDQYQLPVEKETWGEGAMIPNAYGLSGGGFYSWKVNRNIFTFFVEGAYTNPWLFTHESYYTAYYQNRRISSTRMYLLDSQIGFEYGNDTRVIKSGMEWLTEEGDTLDFTVQYKEHGSMNAKIQYDNSPYPDVKPMDMVTPSGENPEKRLDFILSGEKKIFSCLSAGGTVGVSRIENPFYNNGTHHTGETDFCSELSLYISCKVF